MNLHLENKVTLITGSSAGIGFASPSKFAHSALRIRRGNRLDGPFSWQVPWPPRRMVLLSASKVASCARFCNYQSRFDWSGFNPAWSSFLAAKFFKAEMCRLESSLFPKVFGAEGPSFHTLRTHSSVKMARLSQSVFRDGSSKINSSVRCEIPIRQAVPARVQKMR